MFAPETKLQDIAIQDHSLAFFLRRYVKDGNWTKQLGELCESEQLNPDLIAEVLLGIGEPNRIPKDGFSGFSTRELVQFLKDGHRHYMNTVIPELLQLLFQLDRSEQATLSPLWKGFIHSYADHLQEHFSEEEKRLFPLALQLENQHLYFSCQSVKACLKYLRHFEDSHMDELEELASLRESLLNFRVDSVSLRAIDRLFLVMSSFERDLAIHDLIEEEVILPRMKSELDRRFALFN